MKFSCEKSYLLSAVLTASQAVYAKSAVPALESLLIEAGQDLRISGYDLKTGIRTRIGADVVSKGEILLNARLFSDIIRKLPNDTVSINVDDNLKAKIVCGMSEFEITGSSPDEYPELPTVDQQKALSLPQGLLKEMISQTIFAVSDSEARPVHTGSLFEVSGDSLTIVSVDGYRLALRRERIKNSKMDECSFVVPGTALSEVEKIASDSEETVRISVGAKHIMFTFGNTVLISRRLEGEFLNYRQAIPQNNKYSIIANRRNLIDCIERVSLIISDRLKSPVRCVFESGSVKMTTVTALGRASDECRIEGNGDGLEIGFNNKYLLDALKAVPDNEIRILLNSGVSPCMIVPVGDEDNYHYMILPVRLKANA